MTRKGLIPCQTKQPNQTTKIINYISKLFGTIFYNDHYAKCASSIFKQITTGLNSDFSFSKTGCQTKAKEPDLPYYLNIAG